MDIPTERWYLQHGAERSIRYHARREGFFDRWRLCSAGVSVVLSSGAAVNIATEGGQALTLAAALIVTIMSTVDLVVGTASMARLHSDLRRRFMALEADILCMPEPVIADIHRWIRERSNIEADEPPIYVAVDLLCENELARATGRPPRVTLGWWSRVTAHWFRNENLGLDAPVKVDQGVPASQ